MSETLSTPVLLPPPPQAVPHESSLDGLAPQVRAGALRVVARMTAKGWQAKIFETLRTQARQAYLYGFGRDYDERPTPRGRVTKVQDAISGWHFFGLAVDIVQNDATPWIAPLAFWNDLGAAYEAEGFTWGGRWTDPYDAPHGQWAKCRRSPSQKARDLYEQGGNAAVWAAVGAA